MKTYAIICALLLLAEWVVDGIVTVITYSDPFGFFFLLGLSVYLIFLPWKTKRK